MLRVTSFINSLSIFSLKPSFSISSKTTHTLATAKTLDESDVGITCYVSSLLGFRGVLKQRYSDFIVNEVDLDGKIVHLTSFDLPNDRDKEKEEDKPVSSDKSYINEIKSFQSLCGEKDAELLSGFLQKIDPGNDVDPIVLSPDSDKSHRAEVHNFFKKNFTFLVTDTVEESEGSLKCIRARLSSEARGVRGKRGKKRKDMGNSNAEKPFDGKQDTQEALGVIGKMLGIQVTIFKMHVKRLAVLNNRLFGIRVGNFCYVKEGLVLGQLLGNWFTITLRGVVAYSVDTIKAAADGLGKNGFINYYGLQRFGSGSVPTHLIGAALL